MYSTMGTLTMQPGHRSDKRMTGAWRRLVGVASYDIPPRTHCCKLQAVGCKPNEETSISGFVEHRKPQARNSSSGCRQQPATKYRHRHKDKQSRQTDRQTDRHTDPAEVKQTILLFYLLPGKLVCTRVHMTAQV